MGEAVVVAVPDGGGQAVFAFVTSTEGGDAAPVAALVDELQPVLDQHSIANVKKVVALASLPTPKGATTRRHLRKNVKELGGHESAIDYEEAISKHIEEAFGFLSDTWWRS